MKERLSETRVRAARLPAEKDELMLSDGDGLYLRIRRSKADPDKTVRQWLFVWKAMGRTHKVGLGGAEEISLTSARTKADALRTRRDAGGTPTRDTADAELRTFSDLFELHERVRPPSPQRREVWDLYVAAAIGRTRLEDLGRRHIVGLLDDIVITGRRNVNAGGRYDMRRTAGKVFGLLKQVCDFGMSRGVLGNSPMAGMRRKDFGHQGIPRDRILSQDEVRELSARFALELRVGPKGREFNIPALHPGAQAACWFLIATCARVGELASMREAHLDRKNKTWTIPAEVAKNRREHVVHLSPFALKMIDAMKRLPTKPPGDKSPKPLDTIYWGGDSLTKALHDRQKLETKPAQDAAGKRAARSVLLLPAGPFTPHDLRRTGASLLQQLGVRSEVIEQCLNHTAPGIVKVYQRAELMDERRAAFDALGARLSELVNTVGIDRALERGERDAA